MCLAQTGITPADRGKSVYRSNCAFCHGLDAKGGRGPNLVSAPLTHGDRDDDIVRVIKQGVPGTSMPAFGDLEKTELSYLLAHLKSLGGNAPRRALAIGDAGVGRGVYSRYGCAGCHRIGDDGSDFGPDLSRIGSARSIEYLRESVVNPDADIPQAFEGVTVTAKDGSKVQGVRINEDTFSVQLRDPRSEFRSFWKDEVTEVKAETKSLMPAFSTLAKTELDNLVAYMASLRGVSIQGDARKAEGVH